MNPTESKNLNLLEDKTYTTHMMLEVSTCLAGGWLVSLVVCLAGHLGSQ